MCVCVCVCACVRVCLLGRGPLEAMDHIKLAGAMLNTPVLLTKLDDKTHVQYLLVLTNVVDTGKYGNILVSSNVENLVQCQFFSVTNTGKASIVVHNTVSCGDTVFHNYNDTCNLQTEVKVNSRIEKVLLSLDIGRHPTSCATGIEAEEVSYLKQILVISISKATECLV